MKPRRRNSPAVALCIMVVTAVAGICAQAQTNTYERSFPQSKAAVDQAVKKMQPELSGHLPSLEGFAASADHPLEHYARGYYQATVQVSATSSGGSLVRISAKVTAWYNDPANSKSGYKVLSSNGRLESDLLDQLAEQLASNSSAGATQAANARMPKPPAGPPTAGEPTIAAPAPRFPDTDKTFPSSLSQGLASVERGEKHSPDSTNADQPNRALQAEADSLQEILKNQAHPNNLVAVKKSGTPVVATPSLTAKPEFLASMHDEFELLNFNADWVHVRISGLSRGWIWRNSVEMPDGIPDTAPSPAAAGLTPVADLFHVTREETAPFPGDWEPLRSKSVKIISVRKVDGNAPNVGPKERLDYTKFLLDKSYKEMSGKPQQSAGIVVIFDSADGGMIAATTATLQQWKAGTLSDAALWHKCFFDPPETFDTTTPSGSQ